MNKGVTLMELLLTMAMLSIIALLFISYTGDVGNVAVDAASWKIQSDIRHAQQLATSTGVAHGVVFTEGTTYTVYKKGEVDTPASDPLDRGGMVVNLSEFGDVAIGNAYQVEYDKVGKPTMGGGGDVTVCSDSGASRRIYVIENTGSVVVDVLDYGSSCSCRLCGREPE